MATGIGRRQDMPPEGGFKPLDFTKQVNYKKTNGTHSFLTLDALRRDATALVFLR